MIADMHEQLQKLSCNDRYINVGIIKVICSHLYHDLINTYMEEVMNTVNVEIPYRKHEIRELSSCISHGVQ